jgi:hypothetical protein
MRYIVCICDECSHAWMSENEMPARCAKCKSSQWDGQEKRDRGRPRKEIAPPAELEEQDAPIESQSPANVPTVIPVKHSPPEKPTRKIKVEAKRPVGKLSKCPHSFFVLEDGTTACPRCKIG